MHVDVVLPGVEPIYVMEVGGHQVAPGDLPAHVFDEVEMPQSLGLGHMLFRLQSCTASRAFWMLLFAGSVEPRLQALESFSP